MALPLTGKHIVCTGAGSGIGRASALRLAALGATVIPSDININATGTLIDELDHAHPDRKSHLHATHLDVTNVAAVTNHLTTAAAACPWRKFDGVFHCAGINPTAYTIEDVSDDYWTKIVDTNLKGTFNVTRAAVPHMAHGSCIVNVASILGLHPAKHMAVYCAAKYGVVGFSKAMALELGSKGVRVNVLAPGYIDTPTNSGVVEGGEAVKEMEGMVAMGRLGTADEVADVVGFLMGDGARYLNGSVIEVNGGTG